MTIKSVYDFKAFKTFQKYSLKNLFILIYLCSLAFIGVGIWFAFASRKSYYAYLFIGILLPIVSHVFYRIMENNLINNNIYLRDTTIQVFTFNEEGFEMEQISKINTFIDKYLYKDIYSIVKYKRYYFIYINRVQAFVIHNEDYVSGSEEELDELFKKIFDKRFIVKRNSKKQAKVENNT